MRMRRTALIPALALGAMLLASPAHAAVVQDQTTGAATPSGDLGVYSTLSTAQSFTAGLSGELVAVDVMAYTPGSPTVPLIVSIYNGAGDLPVGTALATESLSAGALAGPSALTRVTFGLPASVTAGSSYVIVLESTTSLGSLYVAKEATPSSYARGGLSQNSGAGFALVGIGSADMIFATYVSIPDSDGSAPAPVMQQVERPGAGCSAFASGAGMNWAGVASGGWSQSWAAWARGGQGGEVCTRTLEYHAGAWAVAP